MPDTETFEPVIIGFTCNWCSYRAADLAGTARVKYAPNVRLVRLMCSGRLDPTFVLKALASGADAVLITGCHPGECHYVEQNYKALRRFLLLRRTLTQMGIAPQRLPALAGCTLVLSLEQAPTTTWRAPERARAAGLVLHAPAGRVAHEAGAQRLSALPPALAVVLNDVFPLGFLHE